MLQIIKHLVMASSTLAILATTSCSGSKMESEVIATKTAVHSCNYIVINTTDGSPAEVELRYSVYDSETQSNKVVANTLSTPFVWGGHAVQVVYDSIDMVRDDGVRKEGLRRLRRNYNPGGADYLEIANYTGTSLEYCIVNNSPLNFYPEKEVLGWGFTNLEEVDKSKVVKQSAVPIFTLVPVLYLIKPEMLPNLSVYIPWGEGNTSHGVISVNKTYCKKIELTSEGLAALGLKSSYSAQEIMALYRNEYTGNSTSLFASYSRALDASIGISSSTISKSGDMKLYSTIKARQTLKNAGQFPLLTSGFTDNGWITDFF